MEEELKREVEAMNEKGKKAVKRFGKGDFTVFGVERGG